MYPNIESPSGGGASANWQTRLPSTFDKSKIPAGADNFFKDGTVIVFTKGGQAMQGGKFTENGDPYNPTGSENANKPVDGGNGNGTVARTGGAGAGTGAGNGAGGAGGSSSMFQYGFSQNTSGDIGASFLNGNYYIDPNKFMGASANFGIMSSIAQLMPFGLGSAFANMTMGGVLNGFMKSIGFNFDFSHFNAQSTTTTTTTTTGTTTTDGTSTTTTTTTGTTTTSGTTTGNPEYRAVAGSNGKVFAKTENGATVHYIKQGDDYVKVEHYDNQSQSYYLGGKKYNADGKQMLAYSTVSEFEKTHPNGYTKVGSSYTVDGTTYVYDDDGKLTQVKDAKGNVQEVTTNNTKEAVKKQIESLGLENATTEVEKDKITITIKGPELMTIARNPDFAPPGLRVFVASTSVVTGVVAGAMAANPDLYVTVTFNFDNKGQLTSKELSSNIPNPDNTLTVFDPSKKTQFKVSYNYDNYADGALRTKK